MRIYTDEVPKAKRLNWETGKTHPSWEGGKRWSWATIVYLKVGHPTIIAAKPWMVKEWAKYELNYLKLNGARTREWKVKDWCFGKVWKQY